MNNHSFTYRIVYKTNGSPLSYSGIFISNISILMYFCAAVYKCIYYICLQNTQTIVNRDYLLYTSFL